MSKETNLLNRLKKNSPEISVIIPTFNRSQFIRNCVLSAKFQSLEPFEIIVVDDGSTDNTWSILKDLGFSNWGYEKNKFRYVRTNNRGVSAARNIGIKLSRGEYIALLDSDDIWKPNKLEIQISSLRDIGFKNIVSHTNEIWMRNGVRLNPHKKHLKKGGNIFENCLKLCCVSPSSSLIHKTVFSEIGFFDEGLLACEDYDFWLRYSARNEFHYIDKPLLVKNGGHSDQLSKKYWGMDRFRVVSLEKLLKDEKLSKYQRTLILRELIFKLDILKNGAKKRNEILFFEEMKKKQYVYQCQIER